jgi:Domain of unknown function (DUF4129)
MKATPHRVARRLSLLLRAAALAVSAVLLAGAASAAQRPEAQTLAEYRGRVSEAVLALEALADSTAAGDSDAGDAMETFNRVRQLLPKAERVGWAGGAVSVDNAWLHEALDSYWVADARLRAERRVVPLRDMAARLRALDSRLAEAAREADGAARDKDAEKGRLNTILRRPEYNQEEAKGGALQRQLDRFFEWLRDLIPDIRLRPGTAGGLSRAAQFFVFGLAFAVLAYALWRFWWRRERAPKSKPLGGARVVLGERLEADQTAADLLEEAERLAREGNLRAAIRKAYVALLCELGDRKVIGLAQHKTNRDYLQAVRQGAPRLYPELLPLTFNFELHWYGAQEASAADWDDFRARCRSALRAI